MKNNLEFVQFVKSIPVPKRNISSAILHNRQNSEVRNMFESNRKSNEEYPQIRKSKTNTKIISYNKLQSEYRNQIKQTHDDHIKTIENRLKQLNKLDVDKQHRQIIQKIKMNNDSELLKPVLEGVLTNDEHIQLQEEDDFEFNTIQETLNQQLQFEVPTTFQFYVNKKKKALNQQKQNYLFSLHDKPIRIQTAKPQVQKKLVKKNKRYNAWYMPIKYWSKVKQTSNQNRLYKIRQDPSYIFKTLFNEQTCNPEQGQDMKLQKQHETFQRNKQELQKSEETLKKLSKQIQRQGNKSWVLKYRLNNVDIF